MYDLLFVKKRRRRKIAALVSLFSATGVGSLVIISFLGRSVGTFTVSVQNSSVRLALCQEQTFKNPTSYLRIDELPSTYYEYTYDWFGSFDLLDNDQNDHFYGCKKDTDGSISGMYFLKYTFYVKNVGNTPAQYTLSVNLDDCTQADDGSKRTLDNTLRIMVFENDPAVENSHEFDVYAKDNSDLRNKVVDKEGNVTQREFVSKYPYLTSDNTYYEDESHPLAKSFLDNSNSSAVIKKTVKNFRKNDVLRYTLVYWLEGDDPQAIPVEAVNEGDDNLGAPEGAKIKLSVDISATSSGS